MKKFLAVILALFFALSVSACAKKDGAVSSLSINDIASAVTSSDLEELDKPDDCVAVLKLLINPTFYLYLTDKTAVSSIQFVNDDAKSLEEEFSYQNNDLSGVVKEIVSISNKKGFIKNGSKISFEILEIDAAVNTDNFKNQIFYTAQNAAYHYAKELSLSVTVKIISDTDIISSQNNFISSAPYVHIHSFSKPTCTHPAKCSCGQVGARALGHLWQPANCNAPKTCLICKMTEGGKTNTHDYINGVCKICGASAYISPKANLKEGDYVGNFSISGSDLVGYGVSVSKNDSVFDFVLITRYYTSEKDADNPSSGYEYNGKTYYSSGAGFSGCAGFELTDEYLKVKNSDGSKEVTFKLKSDGNLVVIEANEEGFEKNMLLSCKVGEFLTI